MVGYNGRQFFNEMQLWEHECRQRPGPHDKSFEENDPERVHVDEPQELLLQESKEMLRAEGFKGTGSSCNPTQQQ